MFKLSILIATLGQRNQRFLQLIDSIYQQAADDVEVLAYWNNGEVPLADIRQKLVDEAKGKYLCFIDDDDEIPDYYIEEILNAIEQNPDYVGWRMQLYHNGEKMKPTYHSLRYDNWSEDENGWYRDVSHLNPIKSSIAKQAHYRAVGGSPEDVPWAAKVRPLLNTEIYIDRPMYFYLHSTDDSRWRGDGIIKTGQVKPKIKLPNFRYVGGK